MNIKTEESVEMTLNQNALQIVVTVKMWSEIFESCKWSIWDRCYFCCGDDLSSGWARRVNYSEPAWCSVPLSAWQRHTIDQSGCQGSLFARGHKPRMGLKWTRRNAFLWIKRLRGVPYTERLFKPFIPENEEKVHFNSDSGSANIIKIQLNVRILKNARCERRKHRGIHANRTKCFWIFYI